MSEPRRSTRTRAREEAAPEPPKEPPVKGPKSLKRKRKSVVIEDSLPATSAADGTPLLPKQTLPIRLLEGQPLPTLAKPQPLDLPIQEWQNIQQSGVLEASLERSRAVWTSGINFRTFHKHFTQPKKVSERTDEDKANNQRQKEVGRNFPQIGGEKENIIVQLVIEPHTFPIKLFGPREVPRTVQKKPPTSHYGPWPNHNQHNQHSHPNQYPPYNPPPSYHAKPQPPPQPRLPPPKPAHTPSHQMPTSSPAPDPVIHMLAARAGTDPQLKAVMKIVAIGTANKEQLEFFQSHINELTAILAKQKEQGIKTGKSPALLTTPIPKTLPPPSTPKSTQSPINSTANQAPSPAPRPPQPVPPLMQSTPKPYSPSYPPPKLQHGPPSQQPHHPYQHQSPHHNQHHFYRPPPPQQTLIYSAPPRTSYRPLIFEFVEGNNDKLYFPSYSYLEWLPNGSGIKLSFLVTRLKPKPEPAVQVPAIPTPQVIQHAIKLLDAPAEGSNTIPQPELGSFLSVPHTLGAPPLQPAVLPAPAPYTPPPRIEDFDESNNVNDIDFYQPVTVLILSTHPDIVHSLPRAVRPPDVVEKYMNEVFDKCKRADETYLAFRLPKDNEVESGEKKMKSGEATPVVATPARDVVMSGTEVVAPPVKRGAGRPRKNPLPVA